MDTLELIRLQHISDFIAILKEVWLQQHLMARNKVRESIIKATRVCNLMRKLLEEQINRILSHSLLLPNISWSQTYFPLAHHPWKVSRPGISKCLSIISKQLLVRLLREVRWISRILLRESLMISRRIMTLQRYYLPGQYWDSGLFEYRQKIRLMYTNCCRIIGTSHFPTLGKLYSWDK